MHSRCKIIKADYVGCGYRVASAPNASLISRPPHVSGSGEGGFARPDARAIRKNSFPSVCFHCQCNNNKTYYTPYKIWRWLFVCLAFCGLRRWHDLTPPAPRALSLVKLRSWDPPSAPPANRRNPPTTTETTNNRTSTYYHTATNY